VSFRDETTRQLQTSDVARVVLRIVTATEVLERPLPEKGEIVLGRGDDADVLVPDPTVSRRHAILRVGPPLSIEDLGAKHGTRVGSRRLERGESTRIELGDPIELGHAVLLLRLAAADAATAAAPAVAAAGVVLADPAMLALRDQVERLARGSISVLLRGETGVGKEIVAQMVHACSPRAAKPLLRLNCAAFSESLLESELFGHERGAFTGATQAKMGLLETANGGTVFFDELGEMPPSLQAKLLRVIEERRVTRVGGLKSTSIDVRFVSATHRDLEAEVAGGRFREDLFFRLNGVGLRIPPLRERRAEIEPMARAFVREFAEEVPFAEPPLAQDAVDRLLAYDWPGNIRELRHAVERAVLLSGGAPLTAADFPLAATPRATATPAARSGRAAPDRALTATLRNDVEELERERIAAALDECGGNRTLAAKRLGVSRNTLSTRIAKYGLDRRR